MKKKAGQQYTIRGGSTLVDRLLRERAIQDRVSLNQAALAALERGLGASPDAVRYDDLDDLAGTWVEDKAFDDAVRKFGKIDRGLWK